MTLNELKKGETAIIKSVNGTGPLRQHFLDMGLIPGAEITLTKLAPLGDPMELMIHGYELTLRLSDAENIEITDPIPEVFNQLTGSNQHVGNFPRITVDKKSGVIRGHNNTDVTDLPGIYSLSPYSS